MKKRSLDAIAGDIHAQERGSIFDIGALLIEAREQCEYGQWMAWVSQEFAWSHDTAENYTKAAELAARFRTVRNLKLTARTINRIARHKDTDEQAAIVKELSKHAKTARLTTAKAERVILIGIGRKRYGELPDSALAALGPLDANHPWQGWHKKAIAELREAKPATDAAAKQIVGKIEKEYNEEESAKYAKAEAASMARFKKEISESIAANKEVKAIIDGDIPPPVLPPPIAPEPPPSFLEAETTPEGQIFKDAIAKLYGLRAKPLAKFDGVVSENRLRDVVQFLLAILKKQEAKPEPKPESEPELKAADFAVKVGPVECIDPADYPPPILDVDGKPWKGWGAAKEKPQ